MLDVLNRVRKKVEGPTGEPAVLRSADELRDSSKGLVLNPGEVVRESTLSGPSTSSRASQQAGLRYERKVRDFLRETFPPWRLDWQPRFSFKDGCGSRRCIQPDAIMLPPSSGAAVVLEIKLTHSLAAWEQLRRLYEPVLGTLYPDLEVCAIVRSFDPGVVLPEPAVPFFSLSPWQEWLDAPKGFGVFQWRG